MSDARTAYCYLDTDTEARLLVSCGIVVDARTAYCYLDTDTLLHFQLFDEIDWLDVIGATVIELVIAPAVMLELNKHKSALKKSVLRLH